MKNAITKPKKNPNLQPSNRIKAISSIVLSAIIGVMAVLIILALSSSKAFAAPQDRVMREGEVGVFHTVKDGIICGSFSEWLSMRDAMLAKSTELVVYYLKKPNSLCVTAKEGIEVIVTESNDRWVEAKVKSGENYITIWTHLAFLKKKGV